MVSSWTAVRDETGSEVGGVEPKVPPTGNSSSEFDVFALSRYRVTRTRRVTCVRACDVARARQSNRARSVQGSRNQAEARAIWADFPPAPLLAHASRVPRTRPCSFCMCFAYVQWNIENSLRTWRGHRPFLLESLYFCNVLRQSPLSHP